MTDQSRPPGGYAGTPGFSEREERARVAWSSYSDRPADDMTHDFRAGYHRGVIDEARRSEVPAPGARRELTPCGNIVCTGCRVCGCPDLGIAPAAPEPQGEPSDAQVDRLIEAGMVALIHDSEVPTGMRPHILGGEVLVIRERTDAEPIVRAVIHAVSPALRAAGVQGDAKLSGNSAGGVR